MMKLAILVVAGVLIFSGPASGQSGDLEVGIHGMKWGMPLSVADGLIKVHEKGPAVYYVNKETIYHYADRQIPSVVYGFYNDRLFAGFITLETPLQLTNLKRYFGSRYGAPRIQLEGGGNTTVYRWRSGDIKIKLKNIGDGEKLKMAVYYAPLSDELNEQEIDRVPVESLPRVPPSGDGSRETMPLFDF